MRTLRGGIVMGKMKVAVYLFGCFFTIMGIISQAYADSAEVMPKGVFNAQVAYNPYLPISKRFNGDGDTEDVSRYFNATLNSNIFPALGALDEIMGGPGTAIIGDSVVDFKYKATEVDFRLNYGVTDRLSVGIFIPYQWLSTDLKEARLDTKNATVGKNPLFGTPDDPFGGAPIVPISLGGVPLTTQDVQHLLGRGLFINGQLAIPGYGYKRVQSWSDSGLSDIEVGARYQYLKNDNWRLAFTGGARFPTGRVDDPDNLVDLGFGTGAYALLFRLNNDYIGIKNLLLDVTIKYDLTLPDEQLKRVTSIQHPIVPLSDEERVDRNIGDIITLEGAGTYTIAEGLDVSLMYRYATKTKDHISGNRNLDYAALEFETDWKYHLFNAGICYSTIPLFQQKKFPLPLKASFEYENVFAGRNNFLKQQDFYVKLDIYF
jgi:hypothetical protein